MEKEDIKLNQSNKNNDIFVLPVVKSIYFKIYKL